MVDYKSLPISRRSLLAGLAAAGAAAGFKITPAMAAGLPLGESQRYSFGTVQARAKQLAAAPYRAPQPVHTDILNMLNADSNSVVSFRRAAALWPAQNSPFSIELFHLGKYFQSPVRINVVEDGKARKVGYDPNAFSFQNKAQLPQLPNDFDYAGFRLMMPDGMTDWASFLGASYFRAEGPGRQYGMSARGLAIDTGLLPGPEEFPVFTEFWLHQPRSAANGPIVVDALLESPSCTGAYRFTISKPDRVTMKVEMTLYIRKDIRRIGIAPLTSMYWFSETNRSHVEDWRPEVHDSDGLSMWTGKGERVWRPLTNPLRPRTSAFAEQNPKGFGLLQRDRLFTDYEDGYFFYEKRPSVWVEPLHNWGKGSVELFEWPTGGDTNDNIDAYWTPAKPARAGETMTYAYKLYWVEQEPFPPANAKVVATRTCEGGAPGDASHGKQKFVVDFAGPALLPLAEKDVSFAVTTSRGTISDQVMERIADGKLWRAFFNLDAHGTAPLELRGTLMSKGKVLTETWLFHYNPDEFQA